ncbi:porin [Salmonella enterica subsp. enterica serovar Wandsworth str. SA20092095]|uniref:fimbria/pilus outer membrane usher protein n=1 Tax=Salmonella enterica TaxID=28901 RepID=UPI0009738AAC|nr:fimbria/pilus outer membrane usher protein [Salmonella enterica]EDN8389002.1 fimbrial biogenesis outer membrane usher protein [Salmonella enterica subsp. enterica serovar Wandsworth]APZ68598.1 porin [Salmonella enterica subsp. enterica serovar Wandsworth str. SA20092095]EAU0046895.1 fimbrial biogenesis outer membrane usher protein [Salmonella enterica]EGZ4492731.1 fimbrial biogenesis outer membrane usher protein [Salmonella enterica subsp. enterica serovar Wandsworth]EHI5301772.1 fimbrial b
MKTLLAELLSAGRPVARVSVCLMVITTTSAIAADRAPGDVEFNTTFLDSTYTAGVDLQQFSRSNGMLAGEFLTDVWLNDELLGTEKLTFSKMADGKVAVCMTPALLARLNVRASVLHNTDKLTAGQCTPVEQVIPSARLTWDSGQQKLVIGVPQEDMEKTARGSVPPSLWQNGSLAAFAAYNASAYQSESGGETFNSQYLSLNSGVNVGGWYLRHNGSLTRQTGSGSRYQSINTYIQHDVTPVRGRFLAGQANTSGRLFDSLSFTGVSLFSDDQMLPESQRGYAPDIRGIARSSARVTVRQGGNVIYETTVPAGAFVINDLYPTGYGGDLSVTVREADGSESTFLVPYASVADLLRPGASRYEAVAGKYRRPDGRDGQPFYQASWQQGITNTLTLYGGGQFSDGYQAFQAGSAVSTPLGALALDVTQARTSTVRDTLSGKSYRITYNKLVSDTQSNIALAAYRFSTREYLDFAQAMEYQNLQKGDVVSAGVLYRTKNRYSLTLSQGLAEGWGTLSVTGLSQNYWDRAGNDIQYQFGYSSRWKRVSYSLTAARNRAPEGSMQTSWLVSFSVPLGEEHPVTFSSAVSHDSGGGLAEQVSLAGTAGERQEMSWGVSGTHSEQGGSTASVSGQYLSPWTSINASAGAGRDNRTLSAGLSGAVVAHPHGVTLTPYTGDTWVVINAPGAAGAEVSSYPGLKLDRWGNAVMPASMPYQRNQVSLDPKGLSDRVELESTTLNVIPRAGAVVVAEFATQQGYALLLTPDRPEDGLPFGATVTDSQGNPVGMSGQGGTVYARVSDKTGRLFATVKGGEKATTCIMPFSVTKETSAMQQITYTCARY